VAGVEAEYPVVRRLGFDPDDVDAWTHRCCRRGAAAEQPAAADRRQQHIQRTRVLEQLQGRGALAGHDQRMVVRRHQGESALLGQRSGDRLAVFGQSVVADDRGAIASGCLDFQLGGVGRHDHRRRDAELTSRERYPLRVVARRERDHPA